MDVGCNLVRVAVWWPLAFPGPTVQPQRVQNFTIFAAPTHFPGLSWSFGAELELSERQRTSSSALCPDNTCERREAEILPHRMLATPVVRDRSGARGQTNGPERNAATGGTCSEVACSQSVARTVRHPVAGSRIEQFQGCLAGDRQGQQRNHRQERVCLVHGQASGTQPIMSITSKHTHSPHTIQYPRFTLHNTQQNFQHNVFMKDVHVLMLQSRKHNLAYNL